MTRPVPKRNAGFTLVEIMVIMAILAVFASFIIPGLFSRIGDSEASSLAGTLDALRSGVLEYRADVRRYPTHLRYLSEPPSSASDLCGRTVPAAFLSQWKGPYVNRSITTAGVKIADATVVDAMSPSPATFTATTTGELLILVQDVDSAVARDVERHIDTTLDFTDDAIRWTNVSGGRGTLSMVLLARGC